MFCRSCGGEFADWVIKCPYCGSVNERADEQLYMQHLEMMRRRLDRVDEESEVVYRRQVNHTLRKAIILLLVLAAAVATVVVSRMIFSKFQERKFEQRQIEQFEWEQQEFPKLDEWYAAGEYDRIVQEYKELLMAGKGFNIYSWKHYYFICDFYAPYIDVHSVRAMIDNGEKYESYQLGSALYSALELKYDTSDEYLNRLVDSMRKNGTNGLTPEEAEQVRVFRAEADAFFSESLHWTQEETDAFCAECRNGSYFRADPCYRRAEKICKGEDS